MRIVSRICVFISLLCYIMFFPVQDVLADTFNPLSNYIEINDITISAWDDFRSIEVTVTNNRDIVVN